MSISIKPGFQGGNRSFDESIAFRGSQFSSEFYQESSVPFSVSMTTCHADNHENDTYSTFVPGGQYNGSLLRDIIGRTAESMHQHNYFELAYILRGNMYQIVEGKQYFYTVGSCCLLNRNTLHTELFSSDYHALFLTITPNLAKRLVKQEENLYFPEEKKMIGNVIYRFLQKGIQPDHENSKDFLDFVPKITETQQRVLVHDIFEQLIKTLISPYYGATYRIHDLLCQLTEILCNPEYYQITHVTMNTSMDSLLFARIDQLLDEYHGRISNHQLSDALNYNGTYLGRIVKNKTGLSLFDYSMTFTMKTAAKLLVTTKKSVSDIMEDLQFTNRTHFYKLFNDFYHMTPKQYRSLETGRKS